MAAELYHATSITSPVGAVWDTFIDVGAWSRWNPTFRTSQHRLTPGRTVWMRLKLGPISEPLRQHVRRVEPGRLLTWRTVHGFPGLMEVDRVFRLTPGDDGTTTLEQSETASGLLARPLTPLLARPILAGFEALGDALPREVEGTDDAHRPTGDGRPRSRDRSDAGPTGPAKRTEMGARQQTGQATWRRSINQHETFDHDSIDSLFYDWDRIGDPDGPPRSPLKFYVPRTTDDVVRCVEECARLGQNLIVRSKGHSSNDLVTPPGVRSQLPRS